MGTKENNWTKYNISLGTLKTSFVYSISITISIYSVVYSYIAAFLRFLYFDAFSSSTASKKLICV